jgi:hypothetical protein
MEIARDLANVSSSDYRKVESTSSKKGFIYVRAMVRKAAGHITLEEFVPGDIMTCAYYCTEIHYVLQGEAEISYSLPPFFQKEKVKKTYAKAGDAYLMYCGERVTFKITSDVPYRHICFLQPAPPLPNGEHLVDDLYEKFNERLFQSFKDREE